MAHRLQMIHGGRYASLISTLEQRPADELLMDPSSLMMDPLLGATIWSGLFNSMHLTCKTRLE